VRVAGWDRMDPTKTEAARVVGMGSRLTGSRMWKLAGNRVEKNEAVGVAGHVDEAMPPCHG
jgi:hypothetical protein